jgi:nucleotide-binding universal stress UspA family protein
MQTPIEPRAAMNEQEGTRVAAARTSDESPEAAPHVLVGVSASHSGLAALRVAVRETVARNGTLHLVRVWRDVGWLFSMTAADIMGMRDRERADGLVLALAVEAAHAIDPYAHVCPEFISGDLYANLLARAEGADLLVLGSGDEQSTEGSIGDSFRRRARCPVVIVDANEQVVHGQEHILAMPQPVASSY